MEHHERTTTASTELVKWWTEEVNKRARCSRCWLRPFQCFCAELTSQYEDIREEIDQLHALEVEIVIYYNYCELGRSANTAHILEALCPQISRRVVYGNTECESKLFELIKSEKERGVSRTCVLYPCSSALSFNSWISHLKEESRLTTPCRTSTIPSIRLILLDGTYPGACRIAKYLEKVAPCLSIDLPCVALDLDKVTGLRSAVAGVMYQPAKDKICTFQAAVLALQQVIVHREAYEVSTAGEVTTRVIGRLLSFLDRWIECLLERRIKLGKTTTKLSNKGIDNLLDDKMKAKALSALDSASVGTQRGAGQEELRSCGVLALQPTARFSIYALAAASPENHKHVSYNTTY